MLQSKSRDQEVILGVDIGTTNIRCYAYNDLTNIVGKAFERLPIHNLNDGGQEIVPNELWESFQNVVKRCLLSANLKAKDVLSLGISTQRGTFVTWDREAGDTFHNFITWKDKRSKKDCELWNSSAAIKFLRYGAFLLYLFTRKKKFQILSGLHFSSSLVLIRLYWIFHINKQLQRKERHGNVLFGTIETWLVWKLTGGKVHATDASNACATGFFDPFRLQWAKWMLRIFDIPSTILPVVKNTCDSYGEILSDIFGASIPIHAVVGDQQASLFGAGCFDKYDINCTMGTGSFFSMNTGNSPLGAYDGIYPLVGWTISSKPTYIVEGGVHDVGTIISWAKNLGLIDHPENSEKIALSVPDNDDVYFLLGTSALKNVNNEKSTTSSFVGLTTHTSKQHMVRSILEALAFQVCELYRIVHNNYGTRKSSLFRMCGGVSRNNFILQLISNVTERDVNRLKNTESSSLGAAFFAGLYCGVWNNQDEIKLLIKESERFSPEIELVNRNQKEFCTWRKTYSTPIIAKQV